MPEPVMQRSEAKELARAPRELEELGKAIEQAAKRGDTNINVKLVSGEVARYLTKRGYDVTHIGDKTCIFWG